MYNQYFGFSEAPFSIAPDPRYLYLSEQHREALAHLLYGIGDHGGFVVLTGEVGTGKTTVCRCLLQQVPDHLDIAVIVNPKLNSQELLQTICDELGVVLPDGEPSAKQLTDALNEFLLSTHARGRNAILIVDEAQNLAPDVLEQLRLLTNLETNERKLLQLILLGQPELNDLLARPSLRQLAQRITARYHLRPLLRNEVTSYIEHRLAIAGCRGNLFSPAAINRIFRYSQGIPRLINLLCDRALLGLYAGNGNLVDVALVRRAAAEVLPRRQHRLHLRWPAWPARAAAGGLAVLAVAALLGVAASMRSPAPDAALDTASAAALPPEAPAQSGWRDRLAQSPATTEGSALQALYAVWGHPLDADNIDCARDAVPGLHCLRLNGLALADLQRHNRPVVLALQIAGQPRFALLKQLHDEVALLHFEQRDWQLPWSELAGSWGGEALAMVAAPVTGLPLKPGDSGALVGWLDEQLRRHFDEHERGWQRRAYDGSQHLGDAAKAAWLASHYLALRSPAAPKHYDAPLLAQVKRFQQQQGLPDDGVVNAATVLALCRAGSGDHPQLVLAQGG